MRTDDGTVHFYVNGVDQGPGATQVPADVYGVIDLYGQAAEATIIQHPLQNAAGVKMILKLFLLNRNETDGGMECNI